MAEYLIPPFLSRLAGCAAQKPFLAKSPFNKHPGLNFEISDWSS
jgi:hypothetical protein